MKLNVTVMEAYKYKMNGYSGRDEKKVQFQLKSRSSDYYFVLTISAGVFCKCIFFFFKPSKSLTLIISSHLQTAYYHEFFHYLISYDIHTYTVDLRR
jgi:hypothetical protein